MRVSRCPQAAILRCASAAAPALLLSAQGLDVHVWRLGAALDRQHQVRPRAHLSTGKTERQYHMHRVMSHPHSRVPSCHHLQLHLHARPGEVELPHSRESAASICGGEKPPALLPSLVSCDGRAAAALHSFHLQLHHYSRHVDVHASQASWQAACQ